MIHREGDAAAVHGGVQAEDRPGGRRLQGPGRGRGVAATEVLEGLDELFDGTGCSIESRDDDVVELVLGGVSEEAPGVSLAGSGNESPTAALALANEPNLLRRRHDAEAWGGGVGGAGPVRRGGGRGRRSHGRPGSPGPWRAL